MAGQSAGSSPPFLVIEGLDGAGTTTQTRLLLETFADRDIPAVRTREPSDGPVGALIRQMLSKRVVAPDGEGGHRAVDDDVLALLFAADRLDHVDAKIEPALGDGRLVVTDRYYHSSLAYQSDRLDDGTIDTEWVRTLNARAPTPDLTLFLEASPDVCLERLRERDSRDIYEGDSQLRDLAERYDAILRELEAAGETVVRIDAEAPLEQVHEAICREVDDRFDLAAHSTNQS
jgi:dTMP kinase